MNKTRFAHVSLNCRDLAVIEKFYTKYFEFKRARVVPLGAENVVFIKNGSDYLELFQAKGDRPIAPPEKDGPSYQGMRHFAFQVDDVDAKLKEMGDDAKIALGPLGFDDFISGWRTVWVKDPEGNIVEISQGFVDEEHPPPLV